MCVCAGGFGHMVVLSLKKLKGQRAASALEEPPCPSDRSHDQTEILFQSAPADVVGSASRSITEHILNELDTTRGTHLHASHP